ncbi:M14 family metallopeptidase [Salirhabdus salicampi]|uniref:M14 family metallopeptidase n=1 Tax=Salirhabdus salicampi TaxID=476102 RepID=UPI0020C4BE9C|nr:M14 family metallocarboxypeptidase [Salirhabdus salicampi]MCP8617469.1 M14 family metallocarboxypeptidase [Salirhabdus salicampi]
MPVRNLILIFFSLLLLFKSPVIESQAESKKKLEPVFQHTFHTLFPHNVSPLYFISGAVDVYDFVGHIEKWTKPNYLKGQIVSPEQTYTYSEVVRDIQLLKWQYPNLIRTKVIGHSVEGRDIIAVKLGVGSKEIMINASHHSREHLTTNLVMNMLEHYAAAYEQEATVEEYDARYILNRVSIWFVPMVNPDGVTLQQFGYHSAQHPEKVLALNEGNTDFTYWKANIRGVDLNRQYPADWEKVDNGVYEPAYKNYKGESPLSEPETRALYDFTIQHDFSIVVAYHSAMQKIFWYYGQEGKRYDTDYGIASDYAKLTGYDLFPEAWVTQSSAGYTDWFIKEMKRPGFTPEITPYNDGLPPALSKYDEAWKRNKAAGLMLAKKVMENKTYFNQ